MDPLGERRGTDRGWTGEDPSRSGERCEPRFDSSPDQGARPQLVPNSRTQPRECSLRGPGGFSQTSTGSMYDRLDPDLLRDLSSQGRGSRSARGAGRGLGSGEAVAGLRGRCHLDLWTTLGTSWGRPGDNHRPDSALRLAIARSGPCSRDCSTGLSPELPTRLTQATGGQWTVFHSPRRPPGVQRRLPTLGTLRITGAWFGVTDGLVCRT